MPLQLSPTTPNSIQALSKTCGQELILFIGSGLSVPLPTGLPVGAEIVVSLLGLDWVIGDERFPYTQTKIKKSAVSAIRFEHILSVYREWDRHDIGTLLGQFADAEPNENHKLIAQLVKEGVIAGIVTTNYDSCIEKALKNEGVNFTVVATKTDIEHCDASLPKVFKIHGTIASAKFGYQAIELEATLESLYKGMPEWREDILLEMISDRATVFLGYSGWDSYDINPVLYQLKESSIFWVAHSTTGEEVPLSPEVSKIIAKSRFTSPTFIDTTHFLGGQPLPRRTSVFSLRPTYDLREHYHPSRFVGRVLEAVHDYTEALSYYKDVAKRSTLSNYFMVEMLDIIRHTGVCYFQTRQYSEALWAYMNALSNLNQYIKNAMEKDPGSKLFLNKVFHDQGLLIHEEMALANSRLHRHDMARKNIETAFMLLEGRGADHITTLTIRSRLLLNRASIDFLSLLDEKVRVATGLQDGLKLVDDALGLKKIIGDVPGLIIGYGHKGQYYMLFSDYENAGNCFFEMFREIQRLKTPLLREILEDPIAGLAFYLIHRVNHGYEDLRLSSYLNNRTADRIDYESYLVEVLLNNVWLSWQEFLNFALENEQIIRLAKLAAV